GLPGETGTAIPAEDEKQMTLVGYGPREETGGRPPPPPPPRPPPRGAAPLPPPPPRPPPPPPPPPAAPPAPRRHPRPPAHRPPPPGEGGGTQARGDARRRPHRRHPDRPERHDLARRRPVRGVRTGPGASCAERGRARDPGRDQGRAQAHRGGDGRVGVHRPAR